MRKVLFLSVAAAILVGLSVPASAGSWKFDLVNNTKSTVTSFKTKEDGEWSGNWLDQKMKAGEEFEMDFGTGEGDCVVRTQITFSDESYFDYDVDYCSVKVIHIHNDELKFR